MAIHHSVKKMHPENTYNTKMMNKEISDLNVEVMQLTLIFWGFHVSLSNHSTLDIIFITSVFFPIKRGPTIMQLKWRRTQDPNFKPKSHELSNMCGSRYFNTFFCVFGF